jgi:hypothetical protein
VYQVALNFFIVLAVFTLVFDLHHRLRGASGPAQVPDPWRGFAATVGTAIAAAALYFLLASATQGSGHVDARASTIELNQVNERFNLLFNVLQSHFILESAFPGALVPPHLRFALWALLLAAIAAPLLDRDRPLAVRLGGSVSLVVAAFCGLVFSVGILLVSKILWLPPRVFMPVGLVWAAVFLFVSMWSGPRLRFGSLLVAWIIAFGFVAKHQQIFVDQWRVNMRDRAAVQAMVASLHQNHSWPEVTHVTVLGGAWNYESGIPTAAGNQSISAFSQPWSIPAIFTEVTGRKFSAPTPEQRAVAVEFCDTAAPRRMEFKTAILDNLAVVCVGPI